MNDGDRKAVRLLRIRDAVDMRGPWAAIVLGSLFLLLSIPTLLALWAAFALQARGWSSAIVPFTLLFAPGTLFVLLCEIERRSRPTFERLHDYAVERLKAMDG